MGKPDFDALADDLERSAELTPATAAAVLGAIAGQMPPGFSWPKDRVPMLQSTDAVIHLVDDALPDWSIKLTGRTNDKDGHWTCTLRRSETLDNDMMIGIGRGPVLSHAILAAMVRLAALRG